MKILFVRHGETSWNESKKFQGNRDVILNKRGRIQANITGEFLKEKHCDSEVLFTSDLSRAYETSLIVNNFLHKKFIVRKNLREVNVNIWGGKTLNYIKDKYDKQLSDWNTNSKYHLPGLESHCEIKNRMKEEILQIIEENKKRKKIIIVSHGVAIKAFLSFLYDRKLEEVIHEIKLKNCSISEIDYSEGIFKIEEINFHKHLSSEGI